jgi:1-deoxy-D-xylulose-5-phosphate reductoisomerase
MRKRVVILGSTGSIGCAAVEVAEALRDEIEVVGLAASRRWELLAEQARRLNVRRVAIADDRHAAELRAASPVDATVLPGGDGLVELVTTTPADFVLAAIVGAAGLPATLAAVECGRDVGLANKEALVIAGELLMAQARRRGGRLIPVDSEHSAVFQAMQAGQPDEVARIYLTASGGPFRTWTREQLAAATLEDALRHPTWSMGPKITIDSATMMNKALEVIEARHLFGLPCERIEVLIHPESIVHSMVEFRDGSVVAQLGTPDMRTPIQYAMTYPRRVSGLADPLRWRQARSLNFEPPDVERFPALRLGYRAAEAGGSSGAVLNAANEAAVDCFRDGRLAFDRMIEVIGKVFERRTNTLEPSLAELLEADAWARREVEACL